MMTMNCEDFEGLVGDYVARELDRTETISKGALAMELHNEPDCERLELLLVRRHIEHCETCRVELTNLLLSDSQGEPQRRESDENMSEDEWKRVATLRSESVRRHSTYVTKLGETGSE